MNYVGWVLAVLGKFLSLRVLHGITPSLAPSPTQPTTRREIHLLAGKEGKRRGRDGTRKGSLSEKVRGWMCGVSKECKLGVVDATTMHDESGDF